MDAAFHTAQALSGAAEPYTGDEAGPTSSLLEGLLEVLDGAGQLDDSGEVHRLSDRQATAAIWIDGHEYSVTLNRKD